MTDLFAVVARLDARGVIAAIPPSVCHDLEPTPSPRREGGDVVLEMGTWMPRTPARHLLPSLALVTGQRYSVRFELSARRSDGWSPWVGTVTLGDEVFAPIPASADGLEADIDEIVATPAVDAVRMRVRVGGAGREAMYEAPWLATLSACDGEVEPTATSTAVRRLPVPARTQMAEPEAIRLRICSPTSVGMALEYLGRPVPTAVLADEVFHAPTDRYGVWSAAVRSASAHGVAGYLLRFPSWDAAAWCLGRGLPIVASIRFGPGELTNAPLSDTTGHLVVITGLEGDDVLVNDPAAPTVEHVARRYRRAEFTRAWLARSGVGYVFLPPSRYNCTQCDST